MPIERADDKKKDDKAAPKADKGMDDKKKDDKAAQKMPIQRADDKKKDDKAAPKAGKADEKKKDDKAAQKMPIQRADKPDQEGAQSSGRQHGAQLDRTRTRRKTIKAAQTMALQRAAEAGTTTADPRVEQDVERQKQGGRPLSSSERQYYEPRFGADFSSVRVHDDAEAARAASDLNAKAFTQGSHIFFGSGYHQPSDTPGRQLMAHELTHTLQQGGAQPAAPAATPVQATPRTPSVIQRQGEEDAVDEAPQVDPISTALDDTQPGDDARYAPLFEAVRTAGPTLPLNVGRYRAPDRILFDKVLVPSYKLDFPDVDAYDQRYGGASGKFTRKKNYKRNEPTAPNQRDKWRQSATLPGLIDAGLAQKLNRARGGIQIPGGTKPRYVVKVPIRGGDPLIYFGTDTQLRNRLMIPNWGHGTLTNPPPARSMQVEHVVELQIANWSENQNANDIDNLVLLQAGINQRSGEVVRDNINQRITALLRHPSVTAAMPAPAQAAPAAGAAPTTTPAAPAAAAPAAPTIDEEAVQAVKRNFYLDFEAVEGAAVGGIPAQLNENDFWTPQEIDDLEHFEAIDVGSMADLGNANEVFVFTSRNGGKYKKFNWTGANTPVARDERGWLSPFTITGKQFNTSPENANDPLLGSLTVRFRLPSMEAQQEINELHFDVERIMPGAQYAGFLNRNQVIASLNQTAQAFGVQIPGASPVTFDVFDINDNGLYLRGRILTDVPLLRGAQIDWELDGGDLRAFKTFTANDIGVPAPLSIRTAALTLAVGTRSGLSVNGRVDFGIDRVGEGFLEARARTGTGGRGRSGSGFALAGGFDFDSQLFDPAHIAMRYEDGAFSGEGHLGIPGGKIKGIRSARIDASYANNTITATGTVQPNIPGVQEGTLGIVYSEQDGMVISGSLQLAENPAIRSGSIEARVQRNPDGSYKVHASGTAQPKVPGIDSALTVTYDDGAFDMSVTASFGRGMLHGSLTAAATNRAINPDTNQPEGEPTERITVYGGGSVTMVFAPWLQGTAGIKLLPNGEIEISGSIGLPNTVNIFDAKRFDRNIFHLNIDIPIVGVSVAGQRVGIFATIGGGLDLRAGIGPGQLQNLNLGVTYNPSHEDQTHVTGHGEFVIPTDAGLRLSIHGGIGVGIPIVSAEAGIEVSGELGLQGEARAAVDVDWTPQTGIVLDASGSVFVEPRLKLDLSAYVKVIADLWLTTIDLYSNRWRLAGTEIGSNLRFGVTFPIHYEQGKPFNLSTDDVQFVIPEIDPQSILSSIF